MHGTSDSPLSKLYGKYTQSHGEEDGLARSTHRPSRLPLQVPAWEKRRRQVDQRPNQATPSSGAAGSEYRSPPLRSPGR